MCWSMVVAGGKDTGDSKDNNTVIGTMKRSDHDADMWLPVVMLVRMKMMKEEKTEEGIGSHQKKKE